MSTSAKTRKPVEDLTTEDLEVFPVWEFLSDDGDDDDADETWVKPIVAQHVPARALSLCMAAAARLPSGIVYPAVLFGDTVRGLLVTGIALLTTKGRVLFHESDSPAERRASLKRLGLAQAVVFPIEFATRAPLSGTDVPALGSFTAESEASYLDPARSTTMNNAVVDQAGRDDAGEA